MFTNISVVTKGMSEAPVWLALISVIFFWSVIVKKIGWIKYLSERFKVNDKFNILPSVFLSFIVPFLLARLLNWSISNFDEIYSSGLLSPAATLTAASVAAVMVFKTIENSRQNDRIKNTISALDNGLFKSENLTRFESAYILLNELIEAEGSFKAVCRVPTRAKEFTEKFRKDYPAEYATIRDILRYSNTLCYGIKSGIYDENMIYEFLGEIMFNAWWAAIIIIQNEMFSYYLETSKNYRKNPDFGRPYNSLCDWISNVYKEQKLAQIGFVLGRLNTGIEVFRIDPEGTIRFYDEMNKINERNRLGT